MAYAGIGLLIAAIFSVDAVTSMGYLVPLFYLCPLWLAFRLPSPWPALWVAALCGVLTVVGLFISPPGIEVKMAAGNRALEIGVIGGVTGLFWHRRRADEALLDIKERLEQQVADQTHTLRRVNQQLTQQLVERRHIEAALRESRERLELATKGADAGVWDWDLRTNRVYFAPRWKSQLGYAEHEIGDTFDEWESRFHPDDRERALEAIRAYLVKESRAGYSGRCGCPDDRRVFGLRCGARSAYSKGVPILCYTSDVTDEMVANYRVQH